MAMKPLDLRREIEADLNSTVVNPPCGCVFDYEWHWTNEAPYPQAGLVTRAKPCSQEHTDEKFAQAFQSQLAAILEKVREKHRPNYEAYRIAGEFFGRLQAGLGFGDLSMYQKGPAIAFQWSFKAGDQRYEAEYSFDLSMLDSLNQAGGAEREANRVIEFWKRTAKEKGTSKEAVAAQAGQMWTGRVRTIRVELFRGNDSQVPQEFREITDHPLIGKHVMVRGHKIVNEEC